MIVCCHFVTPQSHIQALLSSRDLLEIRICIGFLCLRIKTQVDDLNLTFNFISVVFVLTFCVSRWKAFRKPYLSQKFLIK